MEQRKLNKSTRNDEQFKQDCNIKMYIVKDFPSSHIPNVVCIGIILRRARFSYSRLFGGFLFLDCVRSRLSIGNGDGDGMALASAVRKI